MSVLRAIVAGLYSLALRIRHCVYNARLIKRFRADIPVVCVGNITVGGTGKTPVVEYLIKRFSGVHGVAVISLGYKRRTKGYLEVQTNSSYLDVGDEPKQIKRKFPGVVVAVCKNRVEGIKRIRHEHPEVDMIIMDDGFQYLKVEPNLNIVLMDYTRPIYRDRMLPQGFLRDLRSQMRRAGIILVTKTPSDLKPIERRLVIKCLKPYPYQSVFFTRMEQGVPVPVFKELAPEVPDTGNVVVMSGIGNPDAMVEAVKRSYDVIDTFIFPDHHAYRVKDLRKVCQRLAELPADTIIITTEKDGVKLTSRRHVPVEIQKKLYVVPIRLIFPEGDEDKFIQTVYKDVKTN